jgi:hypothetical protein
VNWGRKRSETERRGEKENWERKRESETGTEGELGKEERKRNREEGTEGELGKEERKRNREEGTEGELGKDERKRNREEGTEGELGKNLYYSAGLYRSGGIDLVHPEELPRDLFQPLHPPSSSSSWRQIETNRPAGTSPSSPYLGHLSQITSQLSLVPPLPPS